MTECFNVPSAEIEYYLIEHENNIAKLILKYNIKNRIKIAIFTFATAH